MLERLCFQSAGLGIVLAMASGAWAYPGGTPDFVTDVAPFCASCHASASGDQLAGVPEAMARKESIESKHLARIRAARTDTGYAELNDAQRELLIAGIKQIDAAARVELLVPAALKAGQGFEVTVEVTGGAGPVVGIALVDSNQRWQARPAPSAGWQILSKPAVMGPDGQPQTRFTDRRNPALPPGLSYVNVYGVTADPTNGQYSKVSVTFNLRAPSMAGVYPLAAVFFYGTEKAAPNGSIETLNGKAPRGGTTGGSGRVRFTAVRSIEVQ